MACDEFSEVNCSLISLMYKLFCFKGTWDFKQWLLYDLTSNAPLLPLVSVPMYVVVYVQSNGFTTSFTAAKPAALHNIRVVCQIFSRKLVLNRSYTPWHGAHIATYCDLLHSSATVTYCDLLHSSATVTYCDLFHSSATATLRGS